MIKAKIIADSISPQGKRITTFELEYCRFLHAEFMTHRAISKNSSSSRAIPLKAMIHSVWHNMAMPIHSGKKQKGMSASRELEGVSLDIAEFLWIASGAIICGIAFLFDKLGLHKQVANRILEPWSHIKVVATATDWDNFFWLRLHKDAQPEIHQLAKLMYLEYLKSVPKSLQKGEWHLPYFPPEWHNRADMNLDIAKKISASLCAQTSYRKSDDSVEKALSIYDRMVTAERVHASPFEHQATPLDDPNAISGNFRGWKQYRQEIPNNVCLKF